jgi:hypothetical protein
VRTTTKTINLPFFYAIECLWVRFQHVDKCNRIKDMETIASHLHIEDSLTLSLRHTLFSTSRAGLSRN